MAEVDVKASNVTLAAPVTDTPPQDDGSSNPIPPYYNPFGPQAASKPAVRPSTPGCSSLSKSLSFEVSQVFYSGGGIAFSLKNTALNYTQRCNVQGIAASVESKLALGPTWWNCTRFDPMHVNYPAEEVYTRILFGPGPKNILGINQTWYCADEDPAKP